MAQAAFSVRMDEALKKQFEGLCSDFGMNVTTAFTIFAKAVVRERRIPFEISQPPPRPKSLAEMSKEELFASLEEALLCEGQPAEIAFAELRKEFHFGTV
jgi:addiction module RelB/DinJ family antitoxin